jgi:hypothetical protein
METVLLTSGIACVIAAAAGGGLKAFNIEIPVLSSPRRQIGLAALGVALGVAAFLVPTNDGRDEPERVPIMLSKTSGPPGARLRVSGTEFDPDETVFITFGGLPLKETVANEDGDIGIVVTIPEDIPPNFGANFIIAIGAESEKTGTKLFEITGERPQDGPEDGPDGPPEQTVTIPSLREVEADVAEEQLRTLGFQVTRTLEFDEEVASGQVVSTDPPAGFEAEEGSSVVLIVSQGPELPADLRVALFSSSDQASVNSPTSYKVTVYNEGPNIATNATLTITFSGVPLNEEEFDLGDVPGWECSVSAVDENGVVTCAISTLVEQAQDTLLIENVIPRGVGNLTLDAAVTTSVAVLDPTKDNNYANLTTPVT